MSYRPDDLSSLFLGHRPGSSVPGSMSGTANGQLRIGELLMFNNDTGQNRVKVNSLVVENVQVNDPQLAMSLYAGQNVLVASVEGQYIIVGTPAVTGGKLDILGGAITHVNGPQPPTPSAPTVEPTFLGLIVTWDGTYADGAEITSDWSRVEVHVSGTSGFNPSAATFRAAIINPEGGDTTLMFAPDTPERYVRLVTRSLTGNRSGPSVETAGTPGDVATFVGDIGGGTTVFYSPSTDPAPTATGIGDWWYTTDTAKAFRWDGATWVEIDLPGVAEALAEAIAAQQAAATKATVYVQPTAPLDDPVGTLAVNDLWLDESDGHASYTWDGSAWVARLLSTGAFEPDSIVASVIIATGTITGPLIEAQAIAAIHMAAESITAENGAIAQLAVVDGNIANLNAGKIDTGTMHAILTISGAVRTAATGARSQMDGQGFRTFDMAENAVIAITGNNEVSVDTVLSLPGANGDMVTTPDDVSLNIVGDIDIRVRVAMDTWTPGSSQYLVGKTGSVDNSAYGFLMDQQDLLRITWSPDGTWENSRNFVANAVTGFADGSVHWVRATVDMDNGAGGCTGTFYTSENGIDWTQLGTSINASGVSSIFAGTLPLAIGAREGNSGVVAMSGKMYAAEVRDGIGGAGTVVANPVFTTHTPGDPSFVDGAGKTWTMNNNAELEAQPGSGGVPTATWSNPSNNSRIVLRPATDDLGDTVEAQLWPPDVAGHTWAHGRISVGVDNFVAGDDRPVTRIHGPINVGDPLQPAIALYGRGDITGHALINLFTERMQLFGMLHAVGTSMQTLETIESTTQGPFTNTTFGSGTVNCGFSFVAPMSGKVMVTVSGELRAHGAFVQAVVLGYEIRTGGTVGSGTIVVAADDDRAIRWQPTRDDAVIETSYTKLASGLTAGDTYNVRTQQKITGVGGGFSGTAHYRQIAVQPQLG